MSRRKKTEHVGTIKGIDLLLHASTGHTAHLTGCGAHKEKKRDKKRRRHEDRRACRNWD